VSILNENVNSDFTAYSERTSIIDASGDTNNNNNHHHDCEDEQEQQKRRWKILKSSKFKNIQIEMLYQRYLLRMNQNNAAHIVWLLFVLILMLGIIHGNFFITRKSIDNSPAKCDNLTAEIFGNLTNELNFTEICNSSTSSDSNADADDNNFHIATNLIQFFLLGLCAILYTILLLCLYKQRINEIYLFHVSYAIIISLVIIDISFSITNQGR
jgi:hypothetical protein